MGNNKVKATKRTAGSKGSIKKLKSQGFIPGVLYSGNGSIPISVEEDTIRHIMDKSSGEVLLNVQIDGNAVTAKVQEVQRDPVTLDIKHIDLMPVSGEHLQS